MTQIETERLLLRPITMRDLYTAHAYAADLENTRLMMFLPYASMEETAENIGLSMAEWRKAQPRHLEFAVLRKDEHIGSITLYFLEDRSEGELGWVLRKDHWGRGYAVEAAAAMLHYAKNSWGVRRMIACCDSENLPSRRVMEKLGMRHVLTGSRRNRSMEEERIELIYEIRL